MNGRSWNRNNWVFIRWWLFFFFFFSLFTWRGDLYPFSAVPILDIVLKLVRSWCVCVFIKMCILIRVLFNLFCHVSQYIFFSSIIFLLLLIVLLSRMIPFQNKLFLIRMSDFWRKRFHWCLAYRILWSSECFLNILCCFFYMIGLLTLRDFQEFLIHCLFDWL